MEMIKNILKPGAAEDDEVLYGSGKSSDHAHQGLSGEGSHFAQAKSTATDPGVTSSTTDPTLRHTAHDADSTPDTSKMPGTYPTQTQTGSGNPYTAKDVDPRLGGTSEHATAGLGSTTATQSSRTGADATLAEQGRNVPASTTTGPHDSKLLNKLDPRVDSGVDNSKTVGSNTTEHHHARDAGVAGSAAVLGKGVHDRHEDERKIPENTGYTGTTPSGVSSSYYSGPAGTGLSGTQSSAATDPAPTHTSHGARDAAVGAGGVGPVEHERKKDNILSSGVGSGEASTTSSHQFGTGSSDHHYGRDAAVGGAGLAGSAALGKHEYNRREAESAAIPATTSHTNTGLAPNTSGLQSNDHYAKDYLKGHSDSNTGSKSVAHPTTTGEKDHHLGRDAAVGGAGLAGAAALGKHEHNKRDDKSATTASATTVPSTTTAPSTSAVPSTTTGPAPNTSGPHKKDWMNKLDPRVDHNAGLDQSIESKALSSDTNTKDHHYGRDAAGLGAAGVGAHEISKHHKEKEIEKNQGSSVVDNSYSSSAAPSHSAATSHNKDHHLGRDAAGLGAAGVGAHEIGKHHKEKESEKNHGSSVVDNSYSSSAVPSQSAAPTHTKDHHLGRDAAGLGAAGVGAHEIGKHHREKELGKDQLASTTPTTSSAGHQYGRDATALGGAAAVGEHEHHKHHEHGHGSAAAPGTGVDPLTKNELPPGNYYGKDVQDPRYYMPMEGAPHNLAGESVGQDRGLGGARTGQHDHKEEKKHSSGGLLSFLHRDKNKKYTQEEEEEFDRQEHEHKSHLGRDAAGGAAIGGAAFEAEKHSKDRNAGVGSTSATPGDTMKPLPTTPTHHGIGTETGTQGVDRTHVDTTQFRPGAGATSLGH